MRGLTFTSTPSHSVLRTMDDYPIYLEAAFRDDVTVSLHELSVKLAHTPIRPLGYDQPRDVVCRPLEKSGETRETSREARETWAENNSEFQ